MAITKNLGDLPANICTPSHLAEVAKNLKTSSKRLSVQVLGEPAMEKLGMGSLLSVSAGSAEEAKLIAVQYKGAAASKKPIVLIGKGITFDTGGISIKPTSGMWDMKYDMCGAATVFGLMEGWDYDPRYIELYFGVLKTCLQLEQLNLEMLLLLCQVKPLKF